MDLKVLIQKSDLKEEGNYFYLLQIDELEFPEKVKKSIKMRTEIQSLTSSPEFQNSHFVFQNLQLANRITLKIACFKTVKFNDDTSNLFKNSTIYGQCNFTFTQRIITLLRESQQLSQDIIFLNEELVEMGRCSIVMKFKPHDFEQQVLEDNRQLEKLYYDPLENNAITIQKNIAEIEDRLVEKQKKYNKVVKHLDYIKTSYKSVAYDQAKLLKQKNQLEDENLNMNKILDKKTNINELHIQIDILQTSEEGIDVLRQKLAQLIHRLQFERVIYNELSENYFALDEHIKRKQDLELEIKDFTVAYNEQKFHIKRLKDLLPQLEHLSQTVNTQEELIQNLQNIIAENQQQANKHSFLIIQMEDLTELKVELSRLQHERQILIEKQNQLTELKELNDGQLPFHFIQSLSNDPNFVKKGDLEEIKQYKKKANEYLGLIEKISQELEKRKIKQSNDKPSNYNRMELIDKIDELRFQIEQNCNKQEILENQIIEQTKTQALVVSDLQQKVIYLDGRLNAYSD